MPGPGPSVWTLPSRGSVCRGARQALGPLQPPHTASTPLHTHKHTHTHGRTDEGETDSSQDEDSRERGERAQLKLFFKCLKTNTQHCLFLADQRPSWDCSDWPAAAPGVGGARATDGACSVEMEALLHGGRQQALPHDDLGGVLGQLQVVDAGVDRRIAGVCSVHLKQAAGRAHYSAESQ